MKKLISLIIATVLILPSFYTFAAPATTPVAPPTVSAPSAILIDAKSGRVLFEKNADDSRYPASTTKIMTGLLAVESGKLNETITIPNQVGSFIDKGSNTISLVEGEEITLEQLLYATMLESANDAAVAIAQYLTGSVGHDGIAKFAELMNQRAKALGATNSTFQNPNGLDQTYPNHKTTARDLSIIAKHAMTLPKFREVVATVKYTIPPTNKQPERDYIVTSNKMIWETYVANRYEYCTGIKTGYTVKADSCFVGGAEKDGVELIAVVMGVAPPGNIYVDTKNMFDYGFANYTNASVATKGFIIENEIKVTKGTLPKVSLVLENDLFSLLKEDEIPNIKQVVNLPKELKAPIKIGDVIGSITYKNGDVELGKVNVVASTEVLPKKFTLINIVLGLILFLVLFLFCWISFVAIYRKMNKGKRKYLIKAPRLPKK